MCAYKKIDTVCPYCGTGCVITCTVDTEANRVIEAKGSPRGVNNEGRLCLKGLQRPASKPSSRNMAQMPSWVPVRPAVPAMKPLTLHKNSCAPSSARTTSTTAPAFDTLHRYRTR